MAFSNTRRRYASFDTVASIPGEVIDAFWFIIDHHLKQIFLFKNLLTALLKILSLHFSCSHDRFASHIINGSVV